MNERPTQKSCRRCQLRQIQAHRRSCGVNCSSIAVVGKTGLRSRFGRCLLGWGKPRRSSLPVAVFGGHSKGHKNSRHSIIREPRKVNKRPNPQARQSRHIECGAIAADSLICGFLLEFLGLAPRQPSFGESAEMIINRPVASAWIISLGRATLQTSLRSSLRQRIRPGELLE